MDTQVETVTITRQEYEELLEDKRWRTAFEYAGVDNWSGCTYAYETLYGDKSE